MTDAQLTLLRVKIDKLEDHFYDQLKTIRQDNNYAYDAGLYEGQIRAIKLVRKLVKETFDE